MAMRVQSVSEWKSFSSHRLTEVESRARVTSVVLLLWSENGKRGFLLETWRAPTPSLTRRNANDGNNSRKIVRR